MPAPATRYDAQLIDRFGSINAFRARRDSRDPAVWGPALDHIRLAENEKGLEKLRSRVCTLTAAGCHPDAELVARLDAVLDDLYELIDVREETAVTLALQLGLTAPAPEPAETFDPHAHLIPALGTTRASVQAGPPPSQPVTDKHTPYSNPALTAFDVRVDALVGDLDRLWALNDRTEADPDLRELGTRHLALTDAETACLFYRVRINCLTDGRWYVDGPLVTTIDQTITRLETHITTRDSHARALDHHLARLEADAARDPARAASLMLATPPTAARTTPGDRSTAAQTASPAAQHRGTGTTPAVTPAAHCSPTPAPYRRR